MLQHVVFVGRLKNEIGALLASVAGRKDALEQLCRHPHLSLRLRRVTRLRMSEREKGMCPRAQEPVGHERLEVVTCGLEPTGIEEFPRVGQPWPVWLVVGESRHDITESQEALCGRFRQEGFEQAHEAVASIGVHVPAVLPDRIARMSVMLQRWVYPRRWCFLKRWIPIGRPPAALAGPLSRGVPRLRPAPH